MMLTSDVIDTPDALAALEDDWKRLADAGRYTLFNTFEWTACWLHHYWQPDYRLHTVVMRRDGVVVAILPLYIQSRNQTCRFLGEGEKESEEVSSEFLDFLIDDDHAGRAGIHDAIAQHLRTLGHCELTFGNCLASSHVASILRHARRATFTVVGREYALPILESFAATTADFSNKQTKRANQVLKYYDKREDLAFVPFSAVNYAADWQILQKLHQQDWESRGQAGAINAPVFEQFHWFMHQTFPGLQQFFSMLKKDGEVLSINHYYLYKNRYYFYLTGTNKQKEKSISPGMLLHYLSIRHLSGCGCIYDFMKGKSEGSYKGKFCKAGERLYTIRVFPGTLPGYLRFAKSRLKQFLAKREH